MAVDKMFPQPPTIVDQDTWPTWLIYISTILLEAESESYDGKLAVAYVIINRIKKYNTTLRQAILGTDALINNDGRPYELFSCWNDDYVSQRKSRLTAVDSVQWELCWQAGSAALWKFVSDPTNGETHYLTIKLTKNIRLAGK